MAPRGKRGGTVLEVPNYLLAGITEGPLALLAERAGRWPDEYASLSSSQLTDDALRLLAAKAQEHEDQQTLRAVNAILATRDPEGDWVKIPRTAAAPEVLLSFLRYDIIRGWVFRKEADGHLYPYLVTEIVLDSDRDGRQFVHVGLAAMNSQSEFGRKTTGVALEPNSVVNKYPQQVFEEIGFVKETQDLIAEHDRVTDRYLKILNEGFAQQYRYTGFPQSDQRWRIEGVARIDHKVIHDVRRSEHKVVVGVDESDLFPDAVVAPLPIRPVLKAFDLQTHDFVWINTEDMTEYQYDLSLRDKIVLPADQRELLDILTTDVDTFVSDIIEGKSAGNVIMCKGKPGTGKTLTAEVYSELIQRPLYAINSGSLGTGAEEVRKNLETVFQRGKRWNVVLLLDEADVFVLERKDNIVQNAVVAEFLRTLEYFDGLLFMTTNRPDDIDDAIISRCAAIIDYSMPDRERARAVWLVQAENNEVQLSDELLDGLLDTFHGISPRDIKMLLRLALRVSVGKKEPLSVDLFRRCAMFRGLHGLVKANEPEPLR